MSSGQQQTKEHQGGRWGHHPEQRKLFVLIIIVVLIFPLFSCSGNSYYHQLTILHTDLPTLSSTVETTKTPNPTKTKIPSLTPQPPTVTFTATLPYEIAQKKIDELIATNGGCNYPCWLGIDPGVSSWEEIRNRLIELSASIEENSLHNGVFVSIPYSKFTDGEIWFAMETWGGKVHDIYTVTYLDLTDTLLKFGKPTEIWVYGRLAGWYDLIDYSIVMYYQKHEIAIHWVGEERNTIVHKENRDYSKLCTNILNEQFGGIKIFSRGKINNVEEFIAQWGSPYSDFSDYQKIEFALGISTQEFYDMFSVRNPNNCINLPFE